MNLIEEGTKLFGVGGGASGKERARMDVAYAAVDCDASSDAELWYDHVICLFHPGLLLLSLGLHSGLVYETDLRFGGQQAQKLPGCVESLIIQLAVPNQVSDLRSGIAIANAMTTVEVTEAVRADAELKSLEDDIRSLRQR